MEDSSDNNNIKPTALMNERKSTPLRAGGLQAIILAGGLGSRLRSAVPDLPKCMAPINGIPFISYLIDYLQQQGVTKFILSLGYMHETIVEYIESNYSRFTINHPPPSFQYSIEQEALGTGGAIRLACSKAIEKTVLTVNGDTLFKIDATKLYAFHSMCGAHCTLSLKPMQNFSRYGTVELNKDYSIKSFKEKQPYTEGLINGGMYALHTEKFLAEDLPKKFSFEKDYLEALFMQRRMFGVIQDEYFIDIGIPEDYEKAKKELVIKTYKN